MSMWNENLFATDFVANIYVDQTSGLFGDIKHVDFNEGDCTGLQSRESVAKHFFDDVQPQEDDILSSDWMESSDIGTYLDALGNESLLPLEENLYDFPRVSVDEDTYVEHCPTPFCSAFNVPDKEPKSVSSGTFVDAFLSPPDSPEQVTPVIESNVPDRSSLPVVDGSLGKNFLCKEEKGFNLCNAEISTIISSSPELYKVIAGSSFINSRKSVKRGKDLKHLHPKYSYSCLAISDPSVADQLNKKDRKKLQNKNAAIRYRQKKKEEAVGIKSEEQILEEKNNTLKMKVEDLQREIKYMKNLMEDVCRAKSLLS
ncbi:uncharacterized protein LOC131932294 [Physella acuta]|uniref:uncharacterized protein LOC131932294 n=1 Tax=Physella acuta TaxID=109671 RepID=UPI0027DB80B3|nr:uncharacterized protein LOC131932294 [Physella acuta]